MNYRELYVKKKYEHDGWKIIHTGAPDFLLLKTQDGKNIDDVMVVEVKDKMSELTYTQKIWRMGLEKKGIKYVVERID